MMYGWNGTGMFGWGGLMMLVWIVVIATLIYFVVRLLDRATRKPDASNAEHILAERYAQGEITLEEYRQMQKNLKP